MPDNYIWIFVGLFIFADLCLFFYILYWRKKRGFNQTQKRQFLNHWNRLSGGRDLKHAVMEADKLLDLVLNQKGFSGPLGEKLKMAKDIFSDLNGVWFAHKLRNRLAHELNANVSDSDLRMALSNFKRALKDLGAL